MNNGVLREFLIYTSGAAAIFTAVAGVQKFKDEREVSAHEGIDTYELPGKYHDLTYMGVAFSDEQQLAKFSLHHEKGGEEEIFFYSPEKIAEIVSGDSFPANDYRCYGRCDQYVTAFSEAAFVLGVEMPQNSYEPN